MKNFKFVITLATIVLLFGCVLSCDNDEMIEARNQNLTKTKSGISNTDARTGDASFDGSEGDPIDLETAMRWAQTYRATAKSEDEHRAHFFGNQIIEQLLQESSCVGIRIYYGIDDNGKKQVMIVGVDAEGKDLLPASGGRVSDDRIIADASLPCPSYCDGNGISQP